MTRTYFDAVLDEKQFPVFNGTPEETKQWLLDNRDAWNLSVCVGKTLQMVSVQEYMKEPDPIIIVTGRDAIILRDGNGGAWSYTPETE